ncbi:MAG TPA: hypothetical protein VGE26_01475 [Sphingobacteriaceae bacterium]
MNKIEKDIWDYIDGTCTPQDRMRAERLIDTDPAYQAAYQEFLTLDADLLKMDFDEPSMGFTRNVMEALKAEPVPGSLRSLIDQRIVYGIGAFFILTFTVLLGVFLYSMDWSETSASLFSEIKMPAVDLESVLNSKYITIFYFADIVLALYILDAFFRKRLHSK